MEELKRIIEDSEIIQEDDALWPPHDRVGRQVSYQLVAVILCLTGQWTSLIMSENISHCSCRACNLEYMSLQKKIANLQLFFLSLL